MKISINNNALLGIIVLAISVVIIVIIIVCVVRYYIKRKYNSIDEYNKNAVSNTISYPENIKQYNKNMINSGIKTPTKSRVDKVVGLFKILKFFKKDE